MCESVCECVRVCESVRTVWVRSRERELCLDRLDARGYQCKESINISTRLHQVIEGLGGLQGLLEIDDTNRP